MEDTNKIETEGKTFTQEEVNGLIKDRLDRAEKKWQEKYANYYSAEDVASKTEELQKQITELGNSLNVANDKANADSEEISKRDQTIADLEAKAKKYETDSVKIRIALENGLPFELANKLNGDTEEELKADAQKMASFMRPTTSMPLRNPEANAEVDGVLAAFKQLNPNLKI